MYSSVDPFFIKRFNSRLHKLFFSWLLFKSDKVGWTHHVGFSSITNRASKKASLEPKEKSMMKLFCENCFQNFSCSYLYLYLCHQYIWARTLSKLNEWIVNCTTNNHQKTICSLMDLGRTLSAWPALIG